VIVETQDQRLPNRAGVFEKSAASAGARAGLEPFELPENAPVEVWLWIVGWRAPSWAYT
jgi:hypothetical protein